MAGNSTSNKMRSQCVEEIFGGDSTSPRSRRSRRIRSREARRARLMAVREEMYSPFKYPSPSLFVTPPRRSGRARRPVRDMELNSDSDDMGGSLSRVSPVRVYVPGNRYSPRRETMPEPILRRMEARKPPSRRRSRSPRRHSPKPMRSPSPLRRR
jgi:hypothetical protein